MPKKRQPSKSNSDHPADGVNRLAEFDRLLASLTPVTPGVFVLLVLFVLLLAAVAVSDNQITRPFSADALEKWGASAGSMTLPDQGWRLFTATFVHAWSVQLLFNAWTLLDLGRFMERVLGSIGFLLLFLITGFCGNLAGLIGQPDKIAAGSTGAIFGLLGALVGFVLRYRSAFPPGALARLRMSVPAFIAFNVGYGLLNNDLHHFEYLGGLFNGLFCGWLLARPLTAESAARRWRGNLLLGLLGVALVLATGWAMALRANMTVEQIRLAKLEAALTELYQSGREKYEAKELPPDEFANVIDKEILPEWRDARTHLEGLQGVLPQDREYWDDLKEYVKLRQQAWELTADALRLGADEAVEAAEKKEAEAAKVADRIAKRHGPQGPKQD